MFTRVIKPNIKVLKEIAMIKNILILIALILSNTLIAQKFSGNVIPLSPGSYDVVVFPFGMDYPIKIGGVDASGHIQIDLSTIDISHIPDDVKILYLSRIMNHFFSACDEPNSLGISDKITALKTGPLFLWQKDEQAGALFLLSDEKLKPWLEDRYYIEPIAASFFEILYVDEDVDINNKCKTTYNLESGNVEAVNHFNLKLKKGFNLVQYKIEEIHKTDPEETSSIPVRILVLNSEEQENIKWMVNYF